MRSLSKRATVALVYVCVFFGLLVTAVGVAGVVGVHSATGVGRSITSDELTSSTATAQLGRSMDAAYATGQEAFLTADPAQRAQLASALYAQIVPQVDTELADLQRLHAHDGPAELRGLSLLSQQWTAVRGLLNPTLAAHGAQPGQAQRLTSDYLPLSAHIDQLIDREQLDATADETRASSSGARTIWLIAATVAIGLAAAVALGWAGTRRVRRAVEPEQEQVEFADTLQIAADEPEAHHLLQRHLERTLSDTSAVVLNRNNSADRLEAVTPLPINSPLAATLRGAEPQSCLAIRSGRNHNENAQRPGLLVCAVCAVSPGYSTCTPLTVGGEVIGSVLLNRHDGYNQAEVLRIRESVSQAAPVLANLRNLAIAEFRAATDSLTGLPNKRAVTDTLKRMFAQASRTGYPLSLVLLDLDHFKQINDRHGHPIGDQVLANVGSVLRAALRSGDFAGRNGGEEFALLLPETDAPAGLEIAQRVRSAIADIALPGVEVNVSASLGVAAYPDHAATPDRLERVADAALFVAKRSGRNRTEMASVANQDAVPAAIASANGHAVEVAAS